SMDVPDGSDQPKLQFTAFVPSADFFRAMRSNQAAVDLIAATGNLVADEDNGLERFITATRRQNFLVPPRRHRAFPLLELAWVVRPASLVVRGRRAQAGRPSAPARRGGVRRVPSERPGPRLRDARRAADRRLS